LEGYEQEQDVDATKVILASTMQRCTRAADVQAGCIAALLVFIALAWHLPTLRYSLGCCRNDEEGFGDAPRGIKNEYRKNRPTFGATL